MDGKTGAFSVTDSRSHRIGRVCRSTYGAELLGAEESFDIGQLIRGIVAEFQGLPVLGRQADHVLDSISMRVATDAKDVYDRCSSDTSKFLWISEKPCLHHCLVESYASTPQHQVEFDIDHEHVH
jgi:hypothetical protein